MNLRRRCTLEESRPAIILHPEPSWSPTPASLSRFSSTPLRAFLPGLAIYLAMAGIVGCGGDLPGDGGDPGSLSAGGDEERAAMAEELRAEEEAVENLVFQPLDLPPADFSEAASETEPNDRETEATPLGPNLMAQGTFSENDRDYYTFTTEGEPQLWMIEATGEGIRSLEYRDLSGDRQIDRRPLEGVATISNLYLPPGTHIVWVRGEGTPYTLRVVPIGPPDPAMEREPNDGESRAHVVRMGRSRLGYLAEDNDEDWYRFSLKNPEHLSLLLAPPPDLSVRADLNGSEGMIVRLQGGAVGDSVMYEVQLPAGDYHIRVTSQNTTVSRNPYRLRIDRLDPFLVPADVEPNDVAQWARPLPESLVIRGEMGVWGDARDYFRLPDRSEPARITVEALELPEGGRLDRWVGLVDIRHNRLGTLESNPEDSTLIGEVPADTAAYLQLRGEGRYALRVTLAPGPEPEPEPAELPLEVTLPSGPHLFAAFWPQAQEETIDLTLRNTSETRMDLRLDAATSDFRWEVTLPDAPVALGPGESRSLPIGVQVAPDAWGDRPVRLTVRATDGQGGIRTTGVNLLSSCEAPPINPSHPTPLPPELLGGINVAWSALGARVSSEDRSRIDRESRVLDGLTPDRDVWNMRRDNLPWDLDVRLAGEEDVQVAGIVLNPAGLGNPWTQAKDFELYLSRDGSSFQAALSGSLDWRPEDQAFVLPAPVPARFARLRVLNSQGWASEVHLSEWKVIAVPGSTPWEREGANVANPDAGGYLVWSDPPVNNARKPGLITEGESERPPRLDDLNPNEWVIGFHHDRAARVKRLQWVQPERDDYPFLSGAQVLVSTGSPLGPWTSVGALVVEPSPGASASLDLPEPVWARYVKLSVAPLDVAERRHLPEIVRIFEAATPGRAGSILGEWGKYSRSAAFERRTTEGPTIPPRREADGNDDADHAQAMDPGTPYQGTVRVGEDVDWYRIRVPDSDNRLEVSLRGMPSLRARIVLQDSRGASLPLLASDEPAPGVHILYEAEVMGGETYFLRVEEPPRSIALVWDNSGSVTPFKPTLYPSLLQFTQAVFPGREFVNLLPFMDSPGFLLEDWSDQPFELQRTLNDYNRRDGSSDAENNLRYTVEEMMDREGTKAIVFLTDADSPGFNSTPPLWDALAAVRPSIFTVELHRGDATHQQDLMQSWASVNAGQYDYFRTGADLDVAFQRATCMIRRPARYELVASSRFEEPPLPGFVAVDPGELELNAVELILDASGSMLQRMEGSRRIEIARDVLSDLVSETIPEGTPLALRIFGHKTPDACDTDLEIPLQPLDRARVRAVIQQTDAMNLAKTPIGASLALVAQDMEDVTGQKLIMLITDGEETCEGDPAGAIRGLKEAGHDVRVNIVGFAIDDEGLKSQFESWAREGGGLYFNASSSQELAEAVDRALRPKFQVLAETGEVVGEGTAGLDPVEVPVGTYTVRILTSPLRTVPEVQVRSEETTTVRSGAGSGQGPG